MLKLDIKLLLDNLYIYDGDTRSAPVLELYSGLAVVNEIVSTTNVVVMRFKTGGFVTATGFEIKYTTIHSSKCHIVFGVVRCHYEETHKGNTYVHRHIAT